MTVDFRNRLATHAEPSVDPLPPACRTPSGSLLGPSGLPRSGGPIRIARRPLVDPSQTNAGFQTTSWGMIVDARSDRSVLERLLRLYWPPVYGLIRRQGFGSHDASDLTQEFLSSVVLARGLLGRADPQRGRFRSFLKQSLRNFLIDHHRAARARRAIAPVTSIGSADQAGTSGSGRDSAMIDPAGKAAEVDQFDRDWVATLIKVALDRVEDSLRAERMTAHWQVFEANIVGPALGRTQALSLDELGKRVGIADPGIISNMLQTVKRRFRRTLRELIAETVDDPALVDDELRDLRHLFDR